MALIEDRISALRASMRQAGLAAYVIPSSDPHMGEYVPACWQARRYFSGFTGSAGTLVVTQGKSGLWTDGRYFIQAENQLLGSGIELFRMGVAGVPSYEDYLLDAVREGEMVGFDGKMLSAETAESMQKHFSKRRVGVRSVDLISPLWRGRPLPPHTDVYLHEEQYAGLSCAEKLKKVRAGLGERHAEGQIYSRLDCVAWLFNIRASDIEYNPVAVSYAAVFPNTAILFIDKARLLEETKSYLKRNGVEVRGYEEIGGFLARELDGETILTDPAGINYELYRILKENPAAVVLEGPDLVVGLKGIKNPTEIENFRTAHIRDGCAMAQFCAAFEQKLNAGETVTEWDVCVMLHQARRTQLHNCGESFATIAAYRENAAMMHYSPQPDSCKPLERSGLLLIDSGGQYPEGTTDITRTFALGPVTREEKAHYTWVLKAHIALATAVFLEGTTGGNLDFVCRGQVQKHGIDYRCGTGHGVGMFGGVHEGPQNIRPKDATVFRSGMTITNEPGIYEQGMHGIRTENLMLVTDAFENEYGKFLKFDILTCFPIDMAPLLPELMTEEEIGWLNGYHESVLQTLAPLLSGAALDWLKRNTRPLRGRT